MIKVKGYYTSAAYMGYIPSIDEYRPFESETEYILYMEESGEI